MSKKLVCLTLGSLLISSFASAKVALNSACELKASNKEIQGTNIDQKFPLASISKVVTTLWAVEALGPDYRFQTKLHVKETAKQGSYDIHIEGSRDPMFGRNMGYFLISELNRKGIKNIDRLTFDQNFLLAWLAEEKPLIAGNTPKYDTVEARAAVVETTIRNALATDVNKDSYARLKRAASQLGINMVDSPNISIGSIKYVHKNQFTAQEGSKVLVLKSSPLRTILKRMNNQSNNYIADNIFWNLGGTQKFNAYAKQALEADQADFSFYNGSGNNEGSVKSPIYNNATCEFMIKSLARLDDLLEKKGYGLEHVIAVASRDYDSTVKNYGGNMAGATIAKTGSVNKAKTLAGAINTAQGPVYFTILMHTDYDLNRSDWGNANRQIKDRLSRLINKYSGPRPIKYNQITTLPFDAKSSLTEPAPVTTTVAAKK